MFDRLYNPVGSMASHHQSVARLINRLMVEAIDHQPRTVQASEQAARGERHWMSALMSLIAVVRMPLALIRRKVGHHCSTEVGIDQLDAATDAQHWLALLSCSPNQRCLETIALGANGRLPGARRRTPHSRVHVCSAREHQPIEPTHQRIRIGRLSELNRQPARRSNLQAVFGEVNVDGTIGEVRSAWFDRVPEHPPTGDPNQGCDRTRDGRNWRGVRDAVHGGVHRRAQRDAVATRPDGFRTPLRHTVAMLRILHLSSRLEATSYLFLIGATILKYAADQPALVSVLGPIHGVLYLGFVFALMQGYNELEWPFSKAVFAAVLGAIPFGGFHVDRNWLPDELPSTPSS
ncbi:MAG: integral membrane protein [Candidatus Poriferisodalaceae bacterium]|jgi:integral membrane protein